MRTKQEILTELQEGLSAGVVTEADIRPFIAVQPVVMAADGLVTVPKPDKLSAVDVMFYIVGVVLFSTILSSIAQSWSEGNAVVHIFLSAGIGLILWAIAYSFIRSSLQSEIRSGLTNALLLTGSLLTIVGGYIVTNEIVGGFETVNYIPMAIAFAVLGGLHLGFDRLIKRDFIALMGVLLAVLAFPALLFGLLEGSDAPMDIWAGVVIISAGILVYATRVFTRLNPDRAKLHNSFDSFAAFVALMSMYVASFGENDILWMGGLIMAVFGIFYLSIILQNKRLLGNGSFFMVLTIITIAFRYFSGYGITFSLIVATAGLLGSAAVAASINKKYFKKPLAAAALPVDPMHQSIDSRSV